jgi:hypothetical protein
MARLTILTAKEVQALYDQPQFSDEERDLYFTLDAREKHQLDGVVATFLHPGAA